MGNNNISINIHGGKLTNNQIGDNRHANMNVSNHLDPKKEEVEVLKQKLNELIQRIETTTELDEETKDEYLLSINGAKSQIENGRCTKGVLKGLNKSLTEFSGIVAGISALAPAVSATVDVIEALLKSS
jgi:hypothetical protein